MLAGVIADDLTGASGVAGDFARYGLAAGVLCGDVEISRPLPWDVLVLHTDSRNLDPDRSAVANARAARAITALRPRVIVRKIDSLLRGHIGGDVVAIMRAIGESRVMVIAAVPREGRKTVEGIQWAGDAPLSNAAGTGPLRIADQFSAAGIAVHGIGMDTVSRGIEAVAEAIRSKDDGIFVCDAATDAHVNDVMVGGLATGIGFIASSYGVAHALLTACARDTGPVLAICGSVSDAARAQVAFALASGCVAAVRWHEGSESRCHARVIDLLKSGRDVLIHTADADSRTGDRPDAGLEPELQTLLATVVHDLPRNVSAFVATGGATAECLRRALGASRLVMLGPEVLPCAPLAVLEEGPFSGAIFVTKPGGFGGASGLVDLVAGAKLASLSSRVRGRHRPS
ncbi:MAG TPA: four-carbon acid sugar kinase family protein [Usitatibacter sp.]|jgi:uncharacterized protein YgbK (DUF1537 family)|nr:four-carbon acid sugar kinase family protein [Usitatibacter sp.]